MSQRDVNRSSSHSSAFWKVLELAYALTLMLLTPLARSFLVPRPRNSLNQNPNDSQRSARSAYRYHGTRNGIPTTGTTQGYTLLRPLGGLCPERECNSARSWQLCTENDTERAVQNFPSPTLRVPVTLRCNCKAADISAWKWAITSRTLSPFDVAPPDSIERCKEAVASLRLGEASSGEAA